jgi:ABC-type siderophore export system fused ATPase/permease subunit
VQERTRTEGRAPMLALAGVLLLLIAAESAREMANTEPGEGVIFNLVYAFGKAVLGAYIVAAVTLVVGAMVYLLAYLRGVRITFAEAIFNRAVVLAAVAALLVYLQ